MENAKNKNLQLIINFIVSCVLIELVVLLFGMKNNSIYVVIAVALLTYLFEKIKSKFKTIKNKRDIIISSIFSLGISIVLLIQSKITFKDHVDLSYTENTFAHFELLDIIRLLILFIITSIVVINIIIWVKNTKFSVIEKNKQQSMRKTNFKFFIVFWILIVIPYFLYLLTYAPGAVLGDSFASITQGLGEVPYNNHHPVLYSMFVGVFMKIGTLFGSNNVGVMLYSTAQLIIISGIIAYFLLWMKKHNIKLIYILFTYLFFVANTVFAAYSIIMWKDPLFCGFVFLMCLYLYDIAHKNGEQLKNFTGIAKFVILMFLIAFFRNNGLFIAAAIYIALLLTYRTKLLIFNIINTITILVIIIIQGPIYTKLGIISPAEESFGIPLQQTARVIAHDGNITEEQKTFLNQILPLERWKENYQPCLADPIKWHPEFNKQFLSENKIQYIKVWLKMLPSNFGEYVKAYLMETYGFWSIETKNAYGFVDTYILENNYDIERRDCIKMLTGSSIENLYSTPDFLGSGTLFWIMSLSIILLIATKKSKYILTLLPCIIGWSTIMIATPVAFSLRYVFMLAYALPLMIILPFMNKREEGVLGNLKA